MIRFDDPSFLGSLKRKIRTRILQIIIFLVLSISGIAVIVMNYDTIGYPWAISLCVLVTLGLIVFSYIILVSEIRVYKRIISWLTSLQDEDLTWIICEIADASNRTITLNHMTFQELSVTVDNHEKSLYLLLLEDPPALPPGEKIRILVHDHRIVRIES